MIFVTTGTQLTFDRLVVGVESWADSIDYKGEIFAQIGESKIKLKYIKTKKFLTPIEYSQIISETTLLIGHAGTGTIITAHDYNLPLIIMPRKFSYKEHRNDHQMDTAAKFKNTPGVYVAEDANELSDLLNKREKLEKCGKYKPTNRQILIDFIQSELK